MTWIYRTTKKNDRIDARKQAILLSIGEIPAVHMPTQEIRQWRQTILHRRKIVGKVSQAKNRIRALLKSQGYTKAFDKGSWWKKINRLWMRSLCEGRLSCGQLWRMQLCNLLEELGVLEGQRKRVTEYLDGYLSGKSGSLFNEDLVCRVVKGKELV
jgi:transposase